jgi:outer membrane protein TolC
LAVWALTGLGCRTFPVYEYRIEGTALKSSPVRAGGRAVESAGELSSYPEISLDPAGVTGYENLPEAIKNLYDETPMPLTLVEVVSELLANSRDIKIQGYTLQIADSQIPINKSIYDLLIQASVGVSKDERQPGSVFASGVTRDRNGSAQVSQLIPTGAIVSLIYEASRQRVTPTIFTTINPTYTQDFRATITQPLLRGFGPFRTNADIHIAQLDRKAEAAEFEAQVQRQLERALTLYWDLVAAVESYDVQVISYTAAADLLRINTAKAEAGVMARTQVLQARASVEARRERVIRARQIVRNIEDSLKQLLFFQSGVPNWDLQLDPVQDLVWREIEVHADLLLSEAFEERPEIRAAARRLESADINVAKTGHDRLPQLDAVGSFGVSGVNGNNDDAFDTATDGDFQNWMIGLEFSYRLQNRQRRYLHQQALSQREQVNEILQQQIDNVTFEVRNALRELRTSRERIEISRSRVASEQANLDAERKRYDVGVSTSFEVLEFQEDLAAAQEAHILAIVDYNKAAIALERARGTLLQAYGIVFDRPALRPVDHPTLFPIGFN